MPNDTAAVAIGKGFRHRKYTDLGVTNESGSVFSFRRGNNEQI